MMPFSIPAFGVPDVQAALFPVKRLLELSSVRRGLHGLNPLMEDRTVNDFVCVHVYVFHMAVDCRQRIGGEAIVVEELVTIDSRPMDQQSPEPELEALS